MARDRKELANVTIKLSKHVPGAETLITLLQTVLTLTKRAEILEKLVIWQVCVDPLELLSPRPRAVRRAQEVAKVRMLSKLVGIVVGMSSQCPKKKVHSVEESTTASQAGNQDTTMIASVGSYFDVGSVSEVTLELRAQMTSAPNVRERESVDIEIDSGVEVSRLPANIGADTSPLHETRLSMCGGWWRQTA